MRAVVKAMEALLPFLVLLMALPATVYSAVFWEQGLQPNPGNITVCFVGNGAANDPARAVQIIEYMREFEYAANIKFNYIGTCPHPVPHPSNPSKDYYGGNIRILIPACSDVTATGQVPGKGCPTNTGNDGWGSWANPPGDLEVRRSCVYNVKLGDDPWNDTPYLDHTLHEIGHALGLSHEHVRSDFDPVCASQVNNDPNCYNHSDPDVKACLDANVLPDHQCCGYGGGLVNGLMTPYDRLSVMHYQFLACGIAGNYDRDGFSEWDKLALHILYPEDSRVAEFVGTTVIRAGEFLSLKSAWMAKGALIDNVAGNFQWRIDGTLWSTAPTLQKFMPNPGVYTLQFSHTDNLAGIPQRFYSYTGKVRVLNDEEYKKLMGVLAVQNTLQCPQSCPGDGDNDGIYDDEDNCPDTSNPHQEDRDDDGFGDPCDNCGSLYNPDQLDTNSHEDDNMSLRGDQHYGNACDADYSNNGFVGLEDFNELRTCFGKSAAGRCRDVDCNGNGFIGLEDFNCLRNYFGKPPGPGIGD